jgi:hypothetical protein
MFKLLGMFGLLLTIGLVAVSPAVAAPPVHGTFDYTESGIDTEVCPGFDVNYTEHGYGFYDIYFDGAGNFLKFISHINEGYVITANGRPSSSGTTTSSPLMRMVTRRILARRSMCKGPTALCNATPVGSSSTSTEASPSTDRIRSSAARLGARPSLRRLSIGRGTTAVLGCSTARTRGRPAPAGLPTSCSGTPAAGTLGGTPGSGAAPQRPQEGWLLARWNVRQADDGLLAYLNEWRTTWTNPGVVPARAPSKSLGTR